MQAAPGGRPVGSSQALFWHANPGKHFTSNTGHFECKPQPQWQEVAPIGPPQPLPRLHFTEGMPGPHTAPVGLAATQIGEPFFPLHTSAPPPHSGPSVTQGCPTATGACQLITQTRIACTAEAGAHNCAASDRDSLQRAVHKGDWTSWPAFAALAKASNSPGPPQIGSIFALHVAAFDAAPQHAAACWH